MEDRHLIRRDSFSLKHNFIKEAGEAFEQAMKGMDAMQEAELLRRLDEVSCL